MQGRSLSTAQILEVEIAFYHSTYRNRETELFCVKSVSQKLLGFSWVLKNIFTDNVKNRLQKKKSVSALGKDCSKNCVLCKLTVGPEIFFKNT